MQKKIEERFNSLIVEGENLISQFPYDPDIGRWDYYVPKDIQTSCQAWLMSVANLIGIIASANNEYQRQCEKVMEKKKPDSVPSSTVITMQGILKSAKTEWDHGLLRKIEYIVAGATFDDFLDHAALYHKGNHKMEASVLASAVLEDAMKKVAQKNGIDPTGKSLEPLINKLMTEGVFTPVQGKRYKTYAGVRKHALHAEWDLIDIRDVGELIEGTRTLIEEFM